MLDFFKKIFYIYFDENSRRTIINFMGTRIRLAGKALRENKFSKFKDAGGDIKDAPKADGLFRVIQLANFELLKIVDNICKEHNLDLWLTFGTLLGAVRHKGFIPWDDDIDVEMRRSDYNKLIEIINANQQNLDIYTEMIHAKGDVNIFLKIRHKRIPNIFIDITPIDEINTKLNKKQRLILSYKIKLFRRLMNFKIRKLIEARDITAITDYINQKSEQLFKFSKKKFIEDSDLVWGIEFQHKVNKYLVYSNSTYFPLKEIEFEGHKFKCVNDIDTFLTEMYGQYMNWPSKLYAHHFPFSKTQTVRSYFGDIVMEDLKKLLNMTEKEIEEI